MSYRCTMTTDGTISDLTGNVVCRIADEDSIGLFLLGYRAGSGPVDGSIIREADLKAWMSAVTARVLARQTVATRKYPHICKCPAVYHEKGKCPNEV